MPINKDNSIQLGFSATLEINDTIEDLCERFGFSKVGEYEFSVGLQLDREYIYERKSEDHERL